METDCVSFRSRRMHGSDDGSDAINGRPSHPIIRNPPHFVKGSLLLDALSTPASAAVSLLPGSNGAQTLEKERVRHALHRLHAGAKRKQLGIRIQKPPSAQTKGKKKKKKRSRQTKKEAVSRMEEDVYSSSYREDIQRDFFS